MTCHHRYPFSLSWSTVTIWFKLSCFCVLLRGQTCNPSRKAIVIMLKLKTPSRQMIKQFSNGYWNTSKIPDFCETHVLISKLRISRKTLVSFSISTLNLVLRSVGLSLDLNEFPFPNHILILDSQKLYLNGLNLISNLSKLAIAKVWKMPESM